MKKRSYVGVLMIIIFILCTSCQNEKDVISKNFPIEKQLKSIKIPTERIFDIKSVSVVDSSIIFLSEKADTIFHVYSLPELSFVSSFGIRGEGPNEFFLPSIVPNNSSHLYVHSNLNMLKKMNIYAAKDTGFMLDEYYLDNVLFGVARNLSIINDSILYYMEETPHQMKMISYDLKTGKPILSRRVRVKEDHGSHFDYANNGFMTVNANTVAYAYLYQNKIDFMNLDFSLRNTLMGQQSEIKIGRNGLDNSIFYYVDGYVGEENFYFRYLGCSLNDSKSQKKGSIIEVYDKDGNPLIRYHLDFNIFRFVVDEKNLKIYAVSEDDEDAILMYDIAE